MRNQRLQSRDGQSTSINQSSSMSQSSSMPQIELGLEIERMNFKRSWRTPGKKKKAFIAEETYEIRSNKQYEDHSII